MAYFCRLYFVHFHHLPNLISVPPFPEQLLSKDKGNENDISANENGKSHKTNQVITEFGLFTCQRVYLAQESM